MNILGKVLNNRTTLVIRKFAPEIMLGAGIAAGVASVIVACTSTLKMSDILDEHKETMYSIKSQEEISTSSEAKHEIVKAKTELMLDTAVKTVKTYSPVICLGAVSITCILGSHGIMRKRNAAIAAAYSVVSSKFKEYRKNVVAELGEKKDYQFLNGLKSEVISVEEVDENGKKHKVKKEVFVDDPERGRSIYAKVFDDASDCWVNNAEMNLMFLRAQQTYFNDVLHTRGHVFLNEVYDALNIPRTSAGAIVGWVEDGDGDNYIDFGLYSIENQENRDFLNGYETAVFLDFNVDGVIYDLI